MPTNPQQVQEKCTFKGSQSVKKNSRDDDYHSEELERDHLPIDREGGGEDDDGGGGGRGGTPGAHCR